VHTPRVLGTASPAELPKAVFRWVAEGLNVLPLQVEGASGLPYAAEVSRAESGKPVVVCVVVGSQEGVQRFNRAWEARDDEAIGKLLGYPSCCRQFFREVWTKQRCTDTTWQMAVNSVKGENVATLINLSGRPEANVLWRLMGIRAVPHLPCRFDCPEAIELGHRLLQLGAEAGYRSEVDLLREVLAWSVEWSALHGIAEIKTPILKVSTRTDATAKRYVVRWEGTRHPLESVSGLDFPYRAPARALITGSSTFRRGINHLVEIHIPPADWYHSDNGFSSRHGMDLLHEPIVRMAREELTGLQGNILDLGCGNGVLLKKICAGNDALVPYGIDMKTSCLDHARELLPSFDENFANGDLFDSLNWSSRRYALGIMMIGRLLEVPRDRAERLTAALRTQCERLLVYVYPGWSSDSFDTLVQRAGLCLLGTGTDGVGFVSLGSE
jgi:hypothetical protein